MEHHVPADTTLEPDLDFGAVSMTLVVLPPRGNVANTGRLTASERAVAFHLADQRAELAFHISWNGTTQYHQSAGTTP